MSAHRGAVVVYVLALASCDGASESSIATPAPSVSAETEPATSKCAPAKIPLAGRLAPSVEELARACKTSDPLVLDAAFDAELTAEWTGEFAYDDGRTPVAITARLRSHEAQLSGDMSEPDTFSGVGHGRLEADLLGDAYGSGQVVLMKTYRTGTIDHSVLYVGKLSADTRRIEGRWRTGALTGAFWLERPALQ